MNFEMNQFQLEEKNFTILIVDDTESNVRLLSFVLRQAGYNVLAAFNGKEALKLLNNRVPDLILMDVLMPDMTGFEVTAQIKQRNNFDATPIIYITALSDLDDKLKAFSTGGVDFITKPFQKEEVLARIKTHLFMLQLIKERDSRIELLKKQEKELKDLQEKKEELIRIVTHDIYTPLISIHGLSDLIEESGSLTGDIKELNQLISNSSEKLIRLVDKILNEEGKFDIDIEVNPSPFSITELIQRVIDLHKPKAILKKIELLKTISTSDDIFVFDEIKIEIALNNLVSNALKFTPTGESVFLVVKQREETLEIIIKDTGIGIPENLIPHLFNSETKKGTKGTDGEIGRGLGLDIVQEYIQLNKGTIKLISEENKGTEFTIQLPLK